MRRFVRGATFFLLSLLLILAASPGGVRAQFVTPNRDTAYAELPNVDSQPVGFAGYYKDPETGLYYAGARYYDPAIGRFTTEDPVSGDVMKPPSLHRYLYSYTNPTTYFDPDGRQALPLMGQAEATALALDSEDRYAMRRNALGRATGQLQGAQVSIPLIASTYLGAGVVGALRTGWLAYTSTGAVGFGLTVAAQRGAPYAEAGAEALAGIPNPVSTLPGSLATRREAQEARMASDRSDLAAAKARAEAVAFRSEVPLADPPFAPPQSAPRNDIVVVTESMHGKVGFGAPSGMAVPIATRPTPRQSEVDIGRELGPDARAQVSFLDGEEVKYGTKGSSRPDFCIGTSCSIEVKNYDIQKNSQSLIDSVVGQAIVRKQNLPPGMVQTVRIDVRGQEVTAQQMIAIQREIAIRSNGAVSAANIEFKSE